MIDTDFGIKVRMSGLCINRYRDNRPIVLIVRCRLTAGRLYCLIGASLVLLDFYAQQA